MLQYKPDGQVHCLSIASIILQTLREIRREFIHHTIINEIEQFSHKWMEVTMYK